MQTQKIVSRLALAVALLAGLGQAGFAQNVKAKNSKNIGESLDLGGHRVAAKKLKNRVPMPAGKEYLTFYKDAKAKNKEWSSVSAGTLLDTENVKQQYVDDVAKKILATAQSLREDTSVSAGQKNKWYHATLDEVIALADILEKRNNASAEPELQAKFNNDTATVNKIAAQAARCLVRSQKFDKLSRDLIGLDFADLTTIKKAPAQKKK